MRALKKSKKDLEMQLKDQEEELDDLAAQVYFLSCYLICYLLPQIITISQTLLGTNLKYLES